MSLIESISFLKLELENVEKETKLLEAGRKASASRVRKSLQNIKVKAHTMRKAICEHTKAMPTKTRSKKLPTDVVPVAVVEESHSSQ
jgi:IS5 family transposase